MSLRGVQRSLHDLRDSRAGACGRGGMSRNREAVEFRLERPHDVPHSPGRRVMAAICVKDTAEVDVLRPSGSRRWMSQVGGKAAIRGSTNPITSNEVALDSWLCRRRSLSRRSTGIRCPGISDGKPRLTQTFDTALIVFWIPERKNAAAAFEGEFRVDPERFCPSPSGLVRPAKVAVA